MISDPVCVCQLLSGGVSAGEKRNGCWGDGHAGSVCGDAGGGGVGDEEGAWEV